MNPQTFEALLHDAGYPFRCSGRQRWRLQVNTGVLRLYLEFVLGPTLAWVRTRGYLEVPSEKADLIAGNCMQLQGQMGLARFEGCQAASGNLTTVEVVAAVPQSELSVAFLRIAFQSVVEAAVWHAPRLQALAQGTPLPPAWPKGIDPALGLRWTCAEIKSSTHPFPRLHQPVGKDMLAVTCRSCFARTGANPKERWLSAERVKP